jgi:hypothetical protein
MSSSLLYHAFGIRGYRYVATRYVQGEIFVRIEAPRESLCCAACGGRHVHVVERFRRWWRTVPIGAKGVWIEMFVPKVECQRCGARRRVEVTFAEPKRRHTRSFERHVMELLQFMTPQDVSFHLGISWDLARTSRNGGWANGSPGRSSSGSSGSPSMKSIWERSTGSSRWCSISTRGRWSMWESGKGPRP